MRRARAERELEEELRLHLEHLEEMGRAAGLSPAQARRAAAIEFGGLEQIQEETRMVNPRHYLHDFVQDVRFGWRTLRHSPAFALVAVLTLALGVGLNTAMFTLLDAALLRPLPVPHAGQLLAVEQTVAGRGGDINRNARNDVTGVSRFEYQHYASGNHVFRGLAAYDAFAQATLMGAQPRALVGTVASCNYFAVLEVAPRLGRSFTPEECAEAKPVVVISDRFWRRQFGGDPGVLGRAITLNRAQFAIIGVMPPGFDGTIALASQFWVPLTLQTALDPRSNTLSDTNVSWLALLGRLRPGATRAQAQADMGVLASQLDAQQAHRVTTVAVHAATMAPMADLHTPLEVGGGVLLAATGLILLLACANLASLLLARATRRRREIAVRLALGAGRGRLVRQLLTESLLLALLGGVAGALVAPSAAGALMRWAVAQAPEGLGIQMGLALGADWRTWTFALAVAACSVCLFGLAPALRASRPDLTTGLKDEHGGADGALAGGRLRNVLVAAQVAMCMVLMLATGLLLRALQRSETVNPGFALAGIEAVSYHLDQSGYTAAQAAAFQRKLQAKLLGLPGVTGVAETALVPLSGDHDMTDVETAGGARLERVQINFASAGLASLLGLRPLQGRMFTADEAAANAHVVVVNPGLARRLWPGTSPLGKVVRRGKVEYRVVGEMGEAQLADLGDGDEPYATFPAGPESQAELSLLVQGRGPGLAQEIAQAMTGADAALPVTVAPLADNLAGQRVPAQILSWLAGGLGLLALLLATLGICGMMFYRMEARQHEMGVRTALGARRADLLGLALRQTLVPVGAGLMIGLAMGAAVSSALSATWLYGVSPWDGVAYVVMPVVLLTMAAGAAYLAARRALRVDAAGLLGGK